MSFVPIKLEQVDQGFEQYVGWAKQRARLILAHMNAPVVRRTFIIAEATVRIVAERFVVRVWITGKNTVVMAGDPVQPLFEGNTAFALMPVLREDWEKQPVGDFAQHVQYVYLEPPRTVMKDNAGLVISDEWTIKHQLVAVRFGKRVAEFEWSETRVYDDAADAYTITGEFIDEGYITDTDVTVRDTASDGTIKLRILHHMLKQDALDNTWGWTDKRLPLQGTWMVEIEFRYGVLVASSHQDYLYKLYMVLYNETYPAGQRTLFDSFSGTEDVVVLSRDIFGRILTYSRTYGGEVWSGSNNPMITMIPGTYYYGVDVPPGPNPNGPPSARYLAAQAEAVLRNSGSEADYLAKVAEYLDFMAASLQQSADIFALRTLDPVELRPDPLVPHADQKKAYVLPVQMTCTLDLEYGTVKRSYTLTVGRMDLPTTSNTAFYGVSVRIRPQEEKTYVGEFTAPAVFSYAPDTKVFTRDEGTLEYVKAYFTSGTDVKRLQTTQRTGASYAGLYKVKSSDAVRTRVAGSIGREDDGYTAQLMQMMCVSGTSLAHSTYAAYSALYTVRGAEYRKENHSFGPVTLPSITNDD